MAKDREIPVKRLGAVKALSGDESHIMGLRSPFSKYDGQITRDDILAIQRHMQDFRNALRLHKDILAKGLVPREFSRRTGISGTVGGGLALAAAAVSFKVPAISDLHRIILLAGGGALAYPGYTRNVTQIGQTNKEVLDALGIKLRRPYSPKNLARRPLNPTIQKANSEKIDEWINRADRAVEELGKIHGQVAEFDRANGDIDKQIAQEQLGHEIRLNWMAKARGANEFEKLQLLKGALRKKH